MARQSPSCAISPTGGRARGAVDRLRPYPSAHRSYDGCVAKGPRKKANNGRGVSMGGLEVTPARRKREAKKRAAEEATWASKSGPVKTYRVDPETLQKQDEG